MKITLVRHGETTANVAKRWQGQTDAPLSDRGVEQTRALARRIAAGAPFTHVVASDLGRTRATVEALGVPYELSTAWREAAVGGWEGLTQAEVTTRFKDELAELAAGNDDIKLGGTGESRREFDARVDEALATLARSLPPEAHALVVTHGGVIWSLAGRVLGFRGKRRPVGRLANVSLTTLTIDGNHTSMLRYNDAQHLGAHAACDACRDREDQRALRVVTSTAAPDATPLPDPLHALSESLVRTSSASLHDVLSRSLGVTTTSLLACDDEHATHFLVDGRRALLVDYNVRVVH